MENKLLKEVWTNVKEFLNIERQEPFYNERDFQVKLASFLEQTRKYKHIRLEYYVPVKNNKGEVLLCKANEHCHIPRKLHQETQ